MSTTEKQRNKILYSLSLNKENQCAACYMFFDTKKMDGFYLRMCDKHNDLYEKWIAISTKHFEDCQDKGQDFCLPCFISMVIKKGCGSKKNYRLQQWMLKRWKEYLKRERNNKK